MDERVSLREPSVDERVSLREPSVDERVSLREPSVERPRQRIRHAGGRFSANARAPSTASSDDHTDSISIAPIRRA